MCEIKGVSKGGTFPLDPQHTHSFTLSDEAMRDCANQIGVPVSYIPDFLKAIEEKGGGYLNSKGVFVALTDRNFKAVLRSFYNHDFKRKRTPNAARKRSDNNQPEGVIYRQADYDLSDFMPPEGSEG